MKWTSAILAICALAPVAFLVPEGAASARNFPELLPLPNGWLPEGVATGRGHVIYAGSRLHGAIYAIDLRTGEGGVAVPPQDGGRIAVGLAFDPRTNFIFAAGGGGGAAYVYNAKTGGLVGNYPLSAPPDPTFINDVEVTRDAAWVTESRRPVLYRIPLGPGGRLPEADAVETIPLGGDYVHGDGNNANGIEATADGDVIIVQSNTGLLFTVDPETGEATTIDLGGYSVSNGDGLLLEGQTLYVVRNRSNLIAKIVLTPDLANGEVVEEITSPHFDVPTTLARFGNGLYAVNARFTTPPTPDTTYGIVRVGR